MTLKELRMWHWRQVLSARKRERLYEETPGPDAKHMAESNRSWASLHLGAVQLLNDLLPDTVEYDCYVADGEALVAKMLPNNPFANPPAREHPPGTYRATVRSVEVRPEGSGKVDIKFDIGERMDTNCQQCGSPVCLDQTHTNASVPEFTPTCLAALRTYYDNYPDGDGSGFYAMGLLSRFTKENINACNRHLGKPDWS